VHYENRKVNVNQFCTKQRWRARNMWRIKSSQTKKWVMHK